MEPKRLGATYLASTSPSRVFRPRRCTSTHVIPTSTRLPWRLKAFEALTQRIDQMERGGRSRSLGGDDLGIVLVGGDPDHLRVIFNRHQTRAVCTGQLKPHAQNRPQAGARGLHNFGVVFLFRLKWTRNLHRLYFHLNTFEVPCGVYNTRSDFRRFHSRLYSAFVALLSNLTSTDLENPIRRTQHALRIFFCFRALMMLRTLDCHNSRAARHMYVHSLRVLIIIIRLIGSLVAFLMFICATHVCQLVHRRPLLASRFLFPLVKTPAPPRHDASRAASRSVSFLSRFFSFLLMALFSFFFFLFYTSTVMTP